jgi:N4-bis(aminopropyl)spermidine synthase
MPRKPQEPPEVPDKQTDELEALSILERGRPTSLRTYDQIPMHGQDLLTQVKRVAPDLASKTVAFVGDHDGTSLLLGLLGARGLIEPPTRMLLLDFDQRLLEMARQLATDHGFADRLETLAYNVFDPLPLDLLETFDVFYTNPPYGASNAGASVRLFVTRGCELVHRQFGTGYVLLPDDARRTWTQEAMDSTQVFLEQHGWRVSAKVENAHGYHLDDDPTLRSASIQVTRTNDKLRAIMPWVRRAVSAEEIPFFYGQSVIPPYPKLIAADGQPVFEPGRLPSSIMSQHTTWIFQANPTKYDISTSLLVETREFWNCNQHAAKIKRGDRVLVWISGNQAGIYAIGKVIDNPVERPDSTAGLNYWVNIRNGLESRPRVLVEYERIFLERPLLRKYLQWDPELWGLSVMKQPRGTNFTVTEAEWQAIETWLEKSQAFAA